MRALSRLLQDSPLKCEGWERLGGEGGERGERGEGREGREERIGGEDWEVLLLKRGFFVFLFFTF